MIIKTTRFAARAFALILAITGPVLAEDFRPALVLDASGKEDKSFNEQVWKGSQFFVAETGMRVMELPSSVSLDREKDIRQLAEKGSTMIIVAGIQHGPAVAKVAADYPQIMFVSIDTRVDIDLPNWRQYTFREHEGSFLVGVAAGLATKSNIVGFVGGMDIPLIHRFACGYKGGVKMVNPEAQVMVNMTGDTPEA